MFPIIINLSLVRDLSKYHFYFIFTTGNPHGCPPPGKVKGFLRLLPTKTWRWFTLSLSSGKAGTQRHTTANPPATTVSGITSEDYTNSLPLCPMLPTCKIRILVALYEDISSSEQRVSNLIPYYLIVIKICLSDSHLKQIIFEDDFI